MAYAIVPAEELVRHCMRFYDEGWGYIYGAYGQIWTQAAQNRATDEQTIKYGQQWVGKHVIDCSGVWWLAMKECGSYMYHGSNTMWNKYTVNKGRLSGGKRTDGAELKVGTAIYTGIKDGDHNHVGVYVGDGKVLEAGGTKVGVILSKITLAKWTCWGEQKYVDYGGEPGLPILRRGDRGSYVTLLQTKLIQLGYNLAPYGADGSFGAKTENAVRTFQTNANLEADGIVGKETWEALDAGTVIVYTVTVPHLSRTVAEEIVKTYGGTMTKEGDA